MKRALWFLPFLILNAQTGAQPPDEIKTMRLTSPAFEEGGLIPGKYTCDGENTSPELRWSGAPPGTHSFVFTVEDPDAPRGTFLHWLIFDLPPTVDYLPPAIPPIRKLANAEKHGLNDLGKLGYFGPCPPVGEASPPSGIHRYIFRVHALDVVIGADGGVGKETVRQAMEGHVLGLGKLTGRYQRAPKR